ncbi:MAG: roadblock/LC7 domain-containing protein [Candidatus Helarchaeota archaeon]|nr:roadblock/LC7 domain-containing protein [Candidatus Helarchaeota archaeon]
MGEPLSEQIKQTLTNLLLKLEARTELEACAVVSKEGMRIACAVGAELDADVYSAASAALVNLGETTLNQLRHGSLKEIIVRGADGYTILTSAGPRHMIVGSCKNTSRMGYYLALLHRFSSKVAQTLGGEVAAPIPAPRPVPTPAASGPTAASLLEPGATIPTVRPTPTPRPTRVQTPPLSQVQPEPVDTNLSEAIDILSPIGEPETISIEEPEPLPIGEPEAISIEEPEPLTIEEPEPLAPTSDVDKGTLFEALQALGVDKGAKPTTQPASGVDTQALMSALKPQPTAAKPSGVPFATSPPSTVKGDSDDDLFKISDKEAVLEALKVLGWEEPEDKK